MFLKTLFKTIAKITTLFIGKEKVYLATLLFAMFVMGLLEVIGVASIAPFMAVVSNPGIIQENYYLSWFYEYSNAGSKHKFLLILGISAIFLVVLANSFNALINWKIITFSKNQGHLVALRLLRKYLSQPYLFYLNKNTSDLGKNILSEVDRTMNGVILPGLLALSRFAITIFILIFLLLLSPLLALISILVLGGVYSIIFIIIRKRLHAYGSSTSTADAERFKTANEAMSGIKELKLHGTEQVFLNRFEVPSKKRAALMAYQQLANILPRYLLDAIGFGAILFLMTYMIYIEKTSGEIIPIVTIFALAGYRLMPALQQIYASVTQLKFNLPALDLLVTDLSSVNEVISFNRKNNPPLLFSKHLIIKDVGFTYPNVNIPVLKNINLKIESNTTVGLVGLTGSGKTTLVDIVLGLLNHTRGKLFVDETELTAENITSWQDNLGYVPQAIYLIDDTIERNIAFAVTDVDIKKVKHAAKMAELDEFIQTLPDGYQTNVGERGIRLSGGQKQRIAIARALYHDPKFLILDEATSALDGLTENIIMDAIHNIAHKKTILMIAHRITTLKECDVIHVLENGTIINSGTYKQLLENDENFKNMANV